MQESPTNSCPKCGFENKPDAVECQRCGIIFEKYEQIQRKKSQDSRGSQKQTKNQTPPPEDKIKTTIPPPEGKKKVEGCAVLLFFALLLPFLFSIFGNTTDNNSIKASTIEYKMASLDAGWQIDTDASVINRYKYLLGNISSKTGESYERIADITVKGQQILKDKFGKQIKLIDLLEQANTSLTGVNTKLSYSEIIAALVILIGQ